MCRLDGLRKRIQEIWVEKTPKIGGKLSKIINSNRVFHGFSIINHLFWGSPIFGNTHILMKLWQVPGLYKRLRVTDWNLRQPKRETRSALPNPLATRHPSKVRDFVPRHAPTWAIWFLRNEGCDWFRKLSGFWGIGNPFTNKSKKRTPWGPQKWLKTHPYWVKSGDCHLGMYKTLSEDYQTYLI